MTVALELQGPDINRRAVENVSTSGLELEKVIDIFAGIGKLIAARQKEGNDDQA